MWVKEVVEPMQYPWAFVIGLKADSHIISSPANADNIASDKIHEVIGCISCISNNREAMLNSERLVDDPFIGSRWISLTP
jgi:hypothetical protein